MMYFPSVSASPCTTALRLGRRKAGGCSIPASQYLRAGRRNGVGEVDPGWLMRHSSLLNFNAEAQSGATICIHRSNARTGCYTHLDRAADAGATLSTWISPLSTHSALCRVSDVVSGGIDLLAARKQICAIRVGQPRSNASTAASTACPSADASSHLRSSRRAIRTLTSPPRSACSSRNAACAPTAAASPASAIAL